MDKIYGRQGLYLCKCNEEGHPVICFVYNNDWYYATLTAESKTISHHTPFDRFFNRKLIHIDQFPTWNKLGPKKYLPFEMINASHLHLEENRDA